MDTSCRTADTESEILEGNANSQRSYVIESQNKEVVQNQEIEDQKNLEKVEGIAVFAGGNVAVYDAAALEYNILEQVGKSFTEHIARSELPLQQEDSGQLQNIIIENAQSSFVDFGDMTPFEVLDRTKHDVSEVIWNKSDIASKQEVNRLNENIELSNFLPSEKFSAESSNSESEHDECMSSADESRDKKKHPQKNAKKTKIDERDQDDADDCYFIRRIRQHFALLELQKIEEENKSKEDNNFRELKHDVKVPNDCWKKLYKYQKTGVRWLSELHNQCVGGILADEMGLGKTIQVISFLRAISFSDLENRGFRFRGLGPVLIICPTTLIYQWLKEFRVWFPLCRVAVLHNSGSFHGRSGLLIQKIVVPRKDGSVLLTSYGTFIKNRKQLVNETWHYVILDEGHKIRNPDAKITLAVKEMSTPHRLILSGSPLQNSLRELWSLVDFVYPGRLGDLKSFVDKFSTPITQGGYANATAVQVRTAYKCACVLRDAINPYLLRRLKKNVEMSINLPSKTEQVLFCNITPCQRRLYEEYLSSRECGRILSGKMDAFVGLMTLRKLCNHPDLITGGPNKFNDYDVTVDEDMEFGAACRSGKMEVLKTLLKLWKRQDQKVLLFSQSRQMLTILEKMIIKQGYDYLRMDGKTPIKKRQRLVDDFNKKSELFIFLLTTRVGGLGINLTGANRVVIFDPDWNPSVDIQARERAWRIGQERNVTIYRFLTGGTIEEKIYHRQVFKLFLSNRVLVDPRQRRFFKTNELHELFCLGDDKVMRKEGTETAALFSGTTKNITRDSFSCSRNFFDKNEKDREGKRKEFRRARKRLPVEVTCDDDDDDDETKALVDKNLSAEKIAELKELARKISRSIGKSAEKRMKITDSETSGNKMKVRSSDKSFDIDVEIPYLQKRRRYKESYKENPKQACVISALQHDHIFTESIMDEQLVEDQANAVAASAAAFIRRSRRCLPKHNFEKQRFGLKKASGYQQQNESKSDNEEEPNFSGAALLNRNSDKNNTGSLLDAIRRRKDRNLELLGTNNGRFNEEHYPSLFDSLETSAPKSLKKHVEMADAIRLFMIQRNGKALTDEILQSFKNRVLREDLLAFRSILKNLCNLQKNSNLWILKDEYH
ncbi:unnamed protein product [Thelazia callipaeda]|uniref:DNA repair and recombination protein RAD54-like n=1 Tax=Thelazia callipaeda TaxID=103827 RepID=A0A0N5D922_THECL|nr:unnamed protein product [Thelazia callipaeda]